MLSKRYIVFLLLINVIVFTNNCGTADYDKDNSFKNDIQGSIVTTEYGEIGLIENNHHENNMLSGNKTDLCKNIQNENSCLIPSLSEQNDSFNFYEQNKVINSISPDPAPEKSKNNLPLLNNK